MNSRLILLTVGFVPIIALVGLRFTQIILLAIGLVIIFALNCLLNYYRKRIRTRRVNYVKLRVDDKQRVSVGVERRRWNGNEQFNWVRLAYVRLPDPDAATYNDCLDFIESAFKSAKRIEVDYRATETLKDGTIMGHFHLNDADFNLQCIKDGRMEVTTMDADNVPSKMLKEDELARQEHKGVHSSDPSVNRTYLEVKKGLGDMAHLLPDPIDFRKEAKAR